MRGDANAGAGNRSENGTLTCRELSHLVSSEQLADASESVREQAARHLSACGDCREFAAQTDLLGQAARGALDPGDESAAHAERIQRLQDNILDFQTQPD